MLYNKYGHRVVYDAASKPDSKLSSLLRDGNWVWNLARSNDLAAIHSKLSLVRLVEEDRLLWIPSKSVQLMTSETWNYIRKSSLEVSWWKLLWFPETIPKHAFIGWLTISNRLQLRIECLSGRFKGDVLCVLGRRQLESREHLFFECSFARRIWLCIMIFLLYLIL